MLVCTCCDPPRVTAGPANAIEVPDTVTVYDAEEGALVVDSKDLEAAGLVYLAGFWRTPDLGTIEGVYLMANGTMRKDPR